MDGWNRIIDGLDDLSRRLDAICKEMDGLRGEIMQLLNQAPGASGASLQPGHGPRPKKYPTALGRNIDALRLELGWTFEDLERLSGIDKKRILDHVNKGVMPRPQMLKNYSDTFTKAFGCPISVADLRAEMRKM
jgi:hypothetical protein